jgi:NADH-quinone oxidoreductase subunit H
MKLGLLLMTEFIHLVTAGFMMSVLFLGGWALFGLENISADPVVTAVVKAGILIGKMFLYCVFALVVRWTIPRFRFDQLMNLAWKVMIPLALANLVCVVFVLQFGWPLPVLTAASVVLFFAAGALAVRRAGSITNPKRAVRKLPAGVPAGVTYAGR